MPDHLSCPSYSALLCGGSPRKVKVPRYKTYPKEFGTMLSPGDPVELNGDDLDVLERLRDLMWEREGEILTWKEDLASISHEFYRLRGTLKRLWKAGKILKFARSFNTQSGRPQYIQWWIWEDV